MKIKIIKSMQINKNWMKPGEEYEARYLPTGKLLQLNPPCQIIDGLFSGAIVPPENYMVIKEEQTYTENQFKASENYWLAKVNHEREQKERAHDLVKGLTNELSKKVEEIKTLNSFVDILSQVLWFSRQNAHVKKNG